jgi:predicted nucleic acid-binding protein
MARRRRSPRLTAAALPDGVVLDAGALTAAAQGDLRARAELTLANELGVRVHISSVTLTEVLRGHPRDAPVHALLKGLDQAPVTPAIGRAAGELLGQTNRNDAIDAIDAIIAITADRAGDHVRLLTGDPDDLHALTAHLPGITVVPI